MTIQELLTLFLERNDFKGLVAPDLGCYCLASEGLFRCGTASLLYCRPAFDKMSNVEVIIAEEDWMKFWGWWDEVKDD